MVSDWLSCAAIRRAWLAGDLLAGVTVAAYLVPQVMAYATIAGLPPVTGLWAAVPALIAYVLFGSSKSLSMGPEATTALMTLVAIKPLAAGDPARYAELASTLALLTGVMAVAAWLLRLGFVADLLSRPVLIGYMAGVGLRMIADQLQHVTGVPVTGQYSSPRPARSPAGLATSSRPSSRSPCRFRGFSFSCDGTGRSCRARCSRCCSPQSPWRPSARAGSVSSGRSRSGCPRCSCPPFIRNRCASCCCPRSPC